jgi:hypothetical protein
VLNIGTLFKKRNKKSDKMAEIKETSVEELISRFSPMEFQWIKGDFSNTVESFKSVSSEGENKFLFFMSGRRINIELLDEFMVYFPAPPDPAIQTPEKKQETKAIRKGSAVTSIVYDSVSHVSEDSPIYKLLRKQKQNQVEVGIKIKLNLPSKDLFSVLSSSFEDAEKEIISFILDGVDMEDIKAALSESIKMNYYQTKNKSNGEGKEKPSNKKNSTDIDEPE